MLALTTFNLTDGSFYVSSYVQWLSKPQSISAGIIIDNTGQCSIQGNVINMSVSLQTTSSGMEICKRMGNTHTHTHTHTHCVIVHSVKIPYKVIA